MKNKKVLIVSLLSATTAALVLAAIGVGTNIRQNVLKATDDAVWNHYTAVAATFDKAGSKEYWVNCSTHEHQFSAPVSDHIVDQGAPAQSFIDSLEANDDRLEKRLPRVVDFEDGLNEYITIYDRFDSLEVVDGEGIGGSKALRAGSSSAVGDCHLKISKAYLDKVFADPNVKSLSFYAKATAATNNFRHKQVDAQYVNGNSTIISCYERNATGYGVTTEYKQFFLTRGVYSQMSDSDWFIQYHVDAAPQYLYIDNLQISDKDYYTYKQNSLEHGYFEKNNDTTYYLRDAASSQANVIITTGSASNTVSFDYDMQSDGLRGFRIDKTASNTVSIMLRGDYQYSNLPDEGILIDFYTTIGFNGWWNDQETGAISNGYDKHFSFITSYNQSVGNNRWHTLHIPKVDINSDGGKIMNLKSPVGTIYIDNIRVATNLSESFEGARALRIPANGNENPEYYGYAVGFNLADYTEAGICRDTTKNFYFLIGWNACTAVDISSERASRGAHSFKFVKKSGGTFQVQPQWLALMDDDSTISFDIYTEDSNRLTCPISGASDRTITIESGVWNTITLTKADFESNSSRFTTNAFGAGTYYIDNMALTL